MRLAIDFAVDRIAITDVLRLYNTAIGGVQQM